jgi:DNA-binding LacI/PurR family transcriptional regulator
VHPRRAGRALVRRSTIGFVTDSLTEPYQFSLLQGAIAAARDRRVDLVACSAGVPDAVPPRHVLPGVGSVDALVVTANTMAYQVGLDEIARYCRSLGNHPA